MLPDPGLGTFRQRGELQREPIPISPQIIKMALSMRQSVALKVRAPSLDDQVSTSSWPPWPPVTPLTHLPLLLLASLIRPEALRDRRACAG